MTRSPTRTPLPEIASIGVRRGPDGSISLHILGIRLLLNTEILRLGSVSMLTSVRLPSSESRVHETTVRSLRYELEANVAPGCTLVGFHIHHTSDLSICTSNYFLPELEEIVVRGDGPAHALHMRDGNAEVQEKRHLRIFCDRDVVEVYANDRFALSTVVYTEEPTALGISLFAKGRLGSALVEEVKVWEDMGSIEMD
ncbi:hypothetical protein V1508DRAFT_442149 [Lipomyces doorenjongii]|uniref:uncharacterized protein n=1 Tax=Lipomyces doorenjongii TaxID=383834 RepID=UPI0034CE63A2